MKLKIALYHNLPSGGAKRSNFDRVRRLAPEHDIDLYCPATANLSYCDVSSYTRTTRVFPFAPRPMVRSPFGRVNSAIRLWNLWRLEILQRRIAAEIDQGGYDVVFVEPCMFSQSPSLIRYLSTPTVYSCHEPPRGLYEPVIPRPYNRRSRRRRLLDRVDAVDAGYRLALRRTDLANVRAASIVLTDSRYTSGIVERIYGVQPRLNLLGVDTEIFRPLHVLRENFILSTGALKPEKGFDLVIESVATIPSSRRPPLVVVSNWEIPAERRYLTSLAAKAGVQVSFRVDISDTELVCLYNQAIITAYGPVREPLGLTPLESEACSTPVVGVAEAGVLETILHDRTGLLVKRDSRAFGQALEKLLSDSRLRAEMGRQGRTYVEGKWSWSSSIVELTDALEDAALIRPRERRAASMASPAGN